MSDNENNVEGQDQEDQLDVYVKLKSLLNTRREIISGKPIKLNHATVEDDVDLSDVLNEIEVPQVNPNKHLKNKEMYIKKKIDEIRELKQNSESQMSFNFVENVIDEEVNKAMADIRNISSKLFKRMTESQKEFNEHLNNNLVEYPENKSHIINHMKLVEDTCKFDRGIEAVNHCEEKLKKSVKNDLKIESLNEFENVCNELAQEVNTIYDAGAQKFKNHEHLLSIKQYNKPLEEMTMENMENNGILDPFTKQPISKPVQNKVCSHIYDSDSIKDMFKRKLFIACPLIGCENKRFTKKDLVFDLNTTSNSN